MQGAATMIPQSWQVGNCDNDSTEAEYAVFACSSTFKFDASMHIHR